MTSTEKLKIFLKALLIEGLVVGILTSFLSKGAQWLGPIISAPFVLIGSGVVSIVIFLKVKDSYFGRIMYAVIALLLSLIIPFVVGILLSQIIN